MSRTPVDAPVLARPLLNLLGAAYTPDGEGVRWQGGTTYESGSCGRVLLRDTGCFGESVVVRDGVGEDDPAGRLVNADAVLAEAIYECSVIGARDEYLARAIATLDAELPRAVEHELWTGAMSTAAGLDNQALTDEDFVVDLTPGTGAVKPTAAVGLLEQALADAYTGVGILHTSRFAFPFLPGTSRTGRIVELKTGTRVVPGVGYPGTGPGGVAPDDGEAWLYITPMVTVRVGPVQDADVLIDRDVNRAVARARQPFETSWDGCSAAFAIRMQAQVE